jgi:hypothetical protein
MIAILRFAQDNVVLVSLVAAVLIVVIAMVVLMANKDPVCPKCECQKCECPKCDCETNGIYFGTEYDSDEDSTEGDDDFSEGDDDEDSEGDFSDGDYENEFSHGSSRQVEGYSNFTNKKNGKCPKGTVEITSGGHKGECYKGGKSLAGARGSSGGKRNSRSGSRKSGGDKNGRELAGRYLSGSKFRNTVGGVCPVGTVKITSGSRKGKCMIDDGGYKYWGWGPHAGLKCRNPDNTGCDTSQGYSKPRAADYRYWGWGVNAGKMCRNKDNTGCDDSYAYSRARPADKTPEPKKEEPKKPPADGHWGWGPNAGKWCTSKNWNQGCSWGKPTVFKNTSTPLTHSSQWKYPGKGKNEGLMCKDEAGTVCDVTSKKPDFHWGWGGNAGMKCRGTVPNTGCSWS